MARLKGNALTFVTGIAFLALILYFLNIEYPNDESSRKYSQLAGVSLILFALSFQIETIRFDSGLIQTRQDILRLAGLGVLAAILIPILATVSLVPQSIIGVSSIEDFFQIIIAPTTELFLFGMIIYPTLKPYLGKLAAAIVTRIMWVIPLHISAVGGNLEALGVIFLIGVGIQVVQETGKKYNTWFELTFHPLFNAINVYGGGL